MVMDSKRALPVLTQLDFWTYLVELLRVSELVELEESENRVILKRLRESELRLEDTCRHKDVVIMAVNAIIELIFEGCKRDAQIANMLAKTTKLLTHVIDTLKHVVELFNANALALINRNLVVIFFDKLVKLLHVALMHPRDYTVETLEKLLGQERRVELDGQRQRNWVYITEMFRIINQLSSSCSFLYGQIEVKLALSRFIAELLMRSENPSVLDEMVCSFDGRRYFDENEVFTKEEMRTYGSLILVEMGMVFKGLYIDKDHRLANG
jgi:hypothetical protein